MTKGAVRREILEGAVVTVAAEVASRRLPVAFEEKDDRTLFYELLTCILGSQVSFEMATASAEQLAAAPVFDALMNAQDSVRLERWLTREMARPILSPSSPCHGRRYRFWRRAASCIAKTSVSVYRTGGLRRFLSDFSDEVESRRLVATTFAGVGPKQASLFLRNIGLASNLAVLDSHVLRYMVRMGICGPMDMSVAPIGAYERAESRLLRYAARLGYPLKYLDEAIWIVMRVSSRQMV